MASAKNTDVVYVRMSEAEKAELELVCKAVGVSQNDYARTAILAAAKKTRVLYADVIERQQELRQ